MADIACLVLFVVLDFLTKVRFNYVDVLTIGMAGLALSERWWWTAAVLLLVGPPISQFLGYLKERV